MCIRDSLNAEAVKTSLEAAFSNLGAYIASFGKIGTLTESIEVVEDVYKRQAFGSVPYIAVAILLQKALASSLTTTWAILLPVIALCGYLLKHTLYRCV